MLVRHHSVPCSALLKVFFIREISNDLIEVMIQGYSAPKSACFHKAVEVGLS
jgi:hypothetical protein